MWVFVFRLWPLREWMPRMWRVGWKTILDIVCGYWSVSYLCMLSYGSTSSPLWQMSGPDVWTVYPVQGSWYERWGGKGMPYQDGRSTAVPALNYQANRWTDDSGYRSVEEGDVEKYISGNFSGDLTVLDQILKWNIIAWSSLTSEIISDLCSAVRSSWLCFRISSPTTLRVVLIIFQTGQPLTVVWKEPSDIPGKWSMKTVWPRRSDRSVSQPIPWQDSTLISVSFSESLLWTRQWAALHPMTVQRMGSGFRSCTITKTGRNISLR